MFQNKDQSGEYYNVTSSMFQNKDQSGEYCNVTSSMFQNKDLCREYCNVRSGMFQNKETLIETAKNIAKNGQQLVKFAKVLAAYSVDKR